MQGKQQRFNELMQAYLENHLSASEYAEFWAMIKDGNGEYSFRNDLTQLWEKSGNEQIAIPDKEWNHKMQQLKERLQREDSHLVPIKKTTPLYRSKWAAAAVLLIAISSVIYFSLNKQKSKDTIVENNNASIQTYDKAPGGNKAVLTLDNGRQIILDSTSNGMLAVEGNANIVKQGDGQLIYDATSGKANEALYNTLTTPRGGQYKITLADGTKVWLNASSSLRYPAGFTGNERKVDISGEAYFEVAKDVRKPFKVQVNQMEIEVIGTHFNINGYANEEAVKTTLLEGRVKVSADKNTGYLKPGQQARLSKTGEMKIADNIDLEETVAWKDGIFQFDNSDIKSVMRQLERWYDMEVEYDGSVNKHFNGTISRNVSLSKVLEMLRQTGEVKFTVSGTKIIVRP